MGSAHRTADDAVTATRAPIPTLRPTARDETGGRVVEASLPGSESWTVGTVRWSTTHGSYRLVTAGGVDLIRDDERPATQVAACALAAERIPVPHATRPAPKVGRIRGVRRVEHKITMYAEEWAEVEEWAALHHAGNRSEALRRAWKDAAKWRDIAARTLGMPES